MVKKTVQKKTPKASTKPRSRPQPQSSTAPSLPSTHQQLLLSIFSTAFSSVLSSESFPTLLQEIKTALFNRDFAAAFGREDYLEAYAARWSPPRALCYAAVLEGLKDELTELEIFEDLGASEEKGNDLEVQGGDVQEAEERPPKRKLKMVALGGCAAEHVAFSSFLSRNSINGALTLLDSAPWEPVTTLLQNAITTPAPISQYASEARKAANEASSSPPSSW